MQSIRSRTPVTSSLKRLRCLSFPGDFEERILRNLEERSEFIKAQLACLSDDVTSGRLQIPEEMGSLWIDCILSTRAQLRATDDETLAAYLKASEFFQDWDTVHELSELLGAHLFSTATEPGDASKQHIVKVLETLSRNLAMEVLRCAPCSLQEQLPRLPQSLTSLAALAHIPSLAASCCSPTEYAHQVVAEDHTPLALCVDTAQEQPVGEAAADEEAADGAAGASMWLQKADITRQNGVNGIFTLSSRPGVVVCRLLAKVGSLQSSTVCLPDSACLLLGPGTRKLQGVTFEGGVVVCSGASCQTTFEDTVFDGCSLLVLAGAQATLTTPAFRNMAASQLGLSVLVHGESSRAIVKGGTVAGGTQGVAVQAGGRLEATDFNITEVAVVGAAVQGEGSCLSLTGCALRFAEEVGENAVPMKIKHGVSVQTGSSAHLSHVSVSGRHRYGVAVRSGASASLDTCNVSESVFCVFVRGTGRLTNCTLSGAGDVGLFAVEPGGRVHATDCRFRRNCVGAMAMNGATLTAVACTSSDSTLTGFRTHGRDGVAELTDCVSDRDKVGCLAENLSTLTATRVQVTRSTKFGYGVSYGGDMVLQDCSAKFCGTHGAGNDGQGCKLHVEGCTFHENGEFAVVARDQAVVTVKDCHSSQHSGAAYFASGESQMKVSSSVSEGDERGCSAERGEQLTMEEVTVDGALQSGQLP